MSLGREEEQLEEIPSAAPTLGAPISPSGHMPPSLSRDTETPCLRSQRLGGRHCWLLSLLVVRGELRAQATPAPWVPRCGSFLRSHMSALVQLHRQLHLTPWGLFTLGGPGRVRGALPHPTNGREPLLPVAVLCFGV